MRRVVVTGIGIVSCIGNNKAEVLESLLNTKSGIVFSEEHKKYNFRSQIVGNIKNLNLSEHIDRKQLRFMGDGSAYNFIALKEAIKESGLKEKMWFFDCHFKEDPVMPGCLGLDAMWQLVGFYLGWLGTPGKGRALGVNSVKFTGEVLKNVKITRYQVDIKRILKKEGAVVGLADGILFADNKSIYEAENLKVGLFKS